MLEQRTQEELTTELSVSIYDTARNDTAKKRREEIVSLDGKEFIFRFSSY